MDKKTKRITLISSIVIIIISIHSLFNFILIPNMQKERVIKGFTENADKFANVHNYIVKTYPFSRCYKDKERKVRFDSTDFSTSGETSQVEVQIKDKLVLEQIEYIFYNLDFEYIENIKDNTYFVFRDARGHFQSIDYATDDITKVEGWKTIKLKDNWYYRSIWIYLLKDKEENNLDYWLRVMYHIVRGY